MMGPPTAHDYFRAVGFTEEAHHHLRSPENFAWLCAFNGTTPDKAPPAWRYASSAGMRDQIDRYVTEGRSPR